MKDKLAFSGKMTTGKSTLSKELERNLNFRIVSIGSTIKKTTTLLIENPLSLLDYLSTMIDNRQNARELYNQLVKEYSAQYQTKSRKIWIKSADNTFLKTDDFRDLLQTVATIGRKVFSDNIWCEFAMTEALIFSELDLPVVIDDLRLPTEKKLFEENGFSVIRLDIDKEEQRRRMLKLYGEVDEKLLNHITEVSLDDATFDFRINTTNFNITDTYRLVLKFLQKNSKKYA